MDADAPTIPPPEPLSRYLGLSRWYLRDANWWPDFPATATQVEMAWTRAGNPRWMGLSPSIRRRCRRCLSAAGPIDVPGFASVTADTFERVAAEQFYSRSALASRQSFDSAKDSFLGAMGPALIQKLMASPPAELMLLASGLERLLDEKHIQLAIKDQALMGAVRERGWDGGIPAVSGDSMFVVDTDDVIWGYLCIHRFPDVKITVNVLEDGSTRHDVVLHYFNKYPQGLPSWANVTMVGGAVFDQATGKFTNTWILGQLAACLPARGRPRG